MGVFVWQCRYPNGSFELHTENLAGTELPQKGTRVQIDGRPWLVKDAALVRDMIRVIVLEAHA